MTDLTALGYTPDHEWVALDGTGPDTGSGEAVATIGITDFAAEQLGDVVYVDLPPVGTTIAAGQVFGEIESTKSVSELFAPVDGEVIAVNDAVDEDPAIVNGDAFAAWLVRVRVSASPEGLLDREAYLALTGGAA